MNYSKEQKWARTKFTDNEGISKVAYTYLIPEAYSFVRFILPPDVEKELAFLTNSFILDKQNKESDNFQLIYSPENNIVNLFIFCNQIDILLPYIYIEELLKFMKGEGVCLISEEQSPQVSSAL